MLQADRHITKSDKTVHSTISFQSVLLFLLTCVFVSPTCFSSGNCFVDSLLPLRNRNEPKNGQMSGFRFELPKPSIRFHHVHLGTLTYQIKPFFFSFLWYFRVQANNTGLKLSEQTQAQQTSMQVYSLAGQRCLGASGVFWPWTDRWPQHRSPAEKRGGQRKRRSIIQGRERSVFTQTNSDTYGHCASFPPLREHTGPHSLPTYGFLYFVKCYFKAIAKRFIALDVICLKRWKQELLDELFCLDRQRCKQDFFF